MAKREADLGPIIDMESIWIRLEELVTEKINEMMEEYQMAGITSEQLEEAKAQIIESVRTMLGEYWPQIEQFRTQDVNDREIRKAEYWQKIEDYRMRDEQDRQQQMNDYWINIQDVINVNVSNIFQEPMGELNDKLNDNVLELTQSMENVVNAALLTFNVGTLHFQFNEIRDAIASASSYSNNLIEEMKNQLSDIQARLE